MNERTVACLLSVFLICLVWSPSFHAQTDDDYEAEIMQHIVDPCFKYSASKSELMDQMSEAEVVTLMKLMSPEAVQETLDVTLTIVRDKPEDARMEIYKVGRELCIKAAGGEK